MELHHILRSENVVSLHHKSGLAWSWHFSCVYPVLILGFRLFVTHASLGIHGRGIRDVSNRTKLQAASRSPCKDNLPVITFALTFPNYVHKIFSKCFSCARRYAGLCAKGAHVTAKGRREFAHHHNIHPSQLIRMRDCEVGMQGFNVLTWLGITFWAIYRAGTYVRT